MSLTPRRFRTKLLLSYVLIVIVPLSLLLGLIYQRTARVIDTQVSRAAMSSLQQATSFVEYQVEYLRRISELVAHSRSLRDILLRPPAEADLSAQLDHYRYVSDLLSSLESGHGPYRIRLYIDDRWFFSRERYNIHALSAFNDVELGRAETTARQTIAVPEREVAYFYNDIQNVFTLVRPVNAPGAFEDPLAVVAVDALSDNIRNVLGELLEPYGGQARLVDDTGQTLIEVKVEPFEPRAGGETLRFEGPLIRSRWTLETDIPTERLYAPAVTFQTYVAGTAIAVVVATAALGLLLSSALSRRVTSLVDAIRAVHDDVFGTRATVVADDEIGLIETEFNAMVTRIADLLSQVEADAVAMRELELEALQSQINPHFLYNTLDLISWKSLKHNAVDLHELVVAMARFYKASLARGAGVVDLAGECEHIRLYVAIENMRFDELVALEFDVPDDLLPAGVPKITLQPLVENSIHHGILESGAANGSILVRARRTGGSLQVEVVDDGVSFLGDGQWHRADSLDVLSAGFGVRNVQNRLRLLCGTESRLEFRAGSAAGTTARITIPFRPASR